MRIIQKYLLVFYLKGVLFCNFFRLTEWGEPDEFVKNINIKIFVIQIKFK